MTRQAVAALLTGLALAACTDQTPSEPRTPSNATASLSSASTTDCDFSGLNSLIAKYFTVSTTQQTAKTYVGQMQQAGAQTDGAIEPGFSVMRLIAGAADGGTAGPVSSGVTLTAELIKCMFTPTVVNRTFLSDSAPKAFTAALDPAGTGAYEVRSPSDGYSIIQSRPQPGGTPISAIAPATTSTTWGSLLNAAPESPHSVLIYGYDISTSTTAGYNWSLVRPDGNFASPYAIVALCTATDNGSTMINESSFGVLAFVNATTLCAPPSSASSLGWLRDRQHPLLLARRLLRWGSDLLSPTPLRAMVLSSTIGGSAGGFKSRFTSTDVTTLTLTFAPPNGIQPPATVRANQQFKVQVWASAPVTTGGVTTISGVNGVCISLTGVTNNGTPTQLLSSTLIPGCANNGQPSALTATVNGVAGIAVFSDIYVTKTGALTLVASGQVAGRSGSGTGSSNKFNVKP